MTPVILTMGLIGVLLLENAILLIVKFVNGRWDIPVIILRFVGNKTRPLVIVGKGMKMFRKGVPLLRVKGYPDPIRDFKNELYYPALRSKYGALLLWEFEDGMLTPVVPTRMGEMIDDETRKKLQAVLADVRTTKWIGFRFQSPRWRKFLHGFFDKLVAKRTFWKERIVLQNPKPEDAARAQKALDEFQKLQVIKFEYDDYLHKQLKLKAVDDVDVDWGLQEKMRIDTQYAGGWRDFLAKYAGHIALILIAAMMLIGVIFVIIKLPELMAACGSQGVETAKNFLAEAAKNIGGSGSVVPPG